VSILAVFLGAAAGSGGLTVTASPPSFGGAAYNTIASRVFGPCTALPAGGSGSYSYAWTVVSTNSSASFSNAAIANPTITIGALLGDTAYTIVRCTVTDTDTLATARVDVLLQYTVYETTGGA
jgi:hypothetical protein